MTCDVTIVTYNIYTCNTCCMSKEMMKMDDRESVMCKTRENSISRIRVKS